MAIKVINLAKTGPKVNGGPGMGMLRTYPTLKDVQANKQTKADFMKRLKRVK